MLRFFQQKLWRAGPNCEFTEEIMYIYVQYMYVKT